MHVVFSHPQNGISRDSFLHIHTNVHIHLLKCTYMYTLFESRETQIIRISGFAARTFLVVAETKREPPSSVVRDLKMVYLYSYLICYLSLQSRTKATALNRDYL